VTAPEIMVYRDASALADGVAARLITRMMDAQSAGGFAHLVLTGGGMGTSALRAVRHSPGRDGIDWARLHVWWGDERYVPAASPDRNELGAYEALLDAVPLDPANVHAMPASDAGFDDVDAAASWYAAELARATSPNDHGAVPSFDVCMLGVGEDGHVASLFPGQPGVYDRRPAFGVRGAPKPPPTRISLSFDSIRASHGVWLITAGEGKAGAVALALGGAGEVEIPAAGARGHRQTLWLLDEAAASQLPRAVFRVASS
jgi:6-phosphogluconolactonase